MVGQYVMGVRNGVRSLMVESQQHMDKLKEIIKELENNGYRVIDLENKSPDAIEIKDNEVIAVEVLGRQYNMKRGYWKKHFTIKQKKEIYHMFDGLIIRTFKTIKKNNPPLK